MKVGVIDYGLGNLPSVTKALARVGVEPEIVSTPDGFDESFAALVLPGVGHFGAGARNLREAGFDSAIKDWVAADRKLLGICVGLQLFFATSEEDRTERGLGIVDGEVKLITGAPKVPHMGWNDLSVVDGDAVMSAVGGDKVYFVHSYHVVPDASVVTSTTTYGSEFCASIRVGSITGVQFHPEKSADVGRRLLEAWSQTL